MAKRGVFSRRNLLVAGAALAVGGGAYKLSNAFQRQPQRLDLKQYSLTFSEEFDGGDVELRDILARWYPHTPWHGDFGDAAFTDPTPDFPFTLANGCLRIEAKKDAGKWRSGLLASANPAGQGFKQRYGYFEIRAKLPPGPGTWPAFWLDSMPPKGSEDPSIEIDVFEYYGKFPEYFNSTVHVWRAPGKGESTAVDAHNRVPYGSLTSDFHTYGVSVDPTDIVVFLDGVEMWRTPTPPEHRHDLIILVNLALGSGWPIDQTPNPSFMYIDYIRAYKRIGT